MFCRINRLVAGCFQAWQRNPQGTTFIEADALSDPALLLDIEAKQWFIKLTSL